MPIKRYGKETSGRGTMHGAGQQGIDVRTAQFDENRKLHRSFAKEEKLHAPDHDGAIGSTKTE